MGKNGCKSGGGHVYKPLYGKKIILGVSGGIAAFKAAEYCRNLTKLGARVRVILTENGKRFVGPVTFSALTGNECLTSMFGQHFDNSPMTHIELATWGDIFVILPATANILGKLACGIADDLLTTLFLAFTRSRLLFPAMNPSMYENPAVQDNIATLKSRGIKVAEPDEGTVVCGAKGKGRLPDFETVLHLVRKMLARQDLKGLNILVTSGPTREYLDPIRFISNRSSGKMGTAIAKMTSIRGGRERLVTGPVCADIPDFLSHIKVESASDMAKAVFSEAKAMDVIIMAAAVSDYTPLSYSETKIKKSTSEISLKLKKTTDILFELGKSKGPGQVLVGFCAETENVIQNGFQKLKNKNLDLMVANDVTEPGAGFGHDTNKVFLIDAEENVEELPLLHKEEVADRILDKVKEIIHSKNR